MYNEQIICIVFGGTLDTIRSEITNNDFETHYCNGDRLHFDANVMTFNGWDG